MRFFRRWPVWAFLVVVLLALGGLLAKRDALLQAFLQHEIRKQTGLEMRTSRFETAFLSPRLKINGLELRDPSSTGKLLAVDAPYLYLQCDLAHLCQRQLHFRILELAVTEIVVSQARDVPPNILLTMDDFDASAQAISSNSPSILGFHFAGIDRLKLTLGRIRLTNPSDSKKVSEIELGLKDQVITNVQSVADLSRSVLKALVQNGITITPGGAAGSNSPP